MVTDWNRIELNAFASVLIGSDRNRNERNQNA